MSLAADTRAAVRAHPFLHDSLRAGVLNHAAAAEWLLDHDPDLEGDPDAVATAIRRFGGNLEDVDHADVGASVSMRSGVDVVDRAAIVDGNGRRNEDGENGQDGDTHPLAIVGDVAVVPGGNRTALRVTGSVAPGVLGHATDRLRIAGIEVRVCAAGGEAVLLVVDRSAGVDALRVLEDALTTVPGCGAGSVVE
ncbi:hypothetical protein SAMN05192561_101697 [Halopenitus malekzadehii]|uniref:Uncharacterized protein n=1 Tax=Halopenitus malekzadehii TaxID=1267564 RepID=A0A1H6I2H9_9EURY|nr:hypothetical protein [Halopenitus malekzadehii]SEH40822.1 hypothetical protein SAMN05192561_101697 [Halopenitus malekzadehii]